MNKLLITGIISVVFCSCQQSVKLTENEKEIISNNIRQMMDDYQADISKEGFIAEFKYLDNSADFFWVPPGYPSAISYDSVVSVIKRTAPLFRSVINTWDTLKIVPLNKEFAAYSARMHSIMTDTSGNKSKIILVETGILVNRNGKWKLHSGQTSTVNQ